MKYLCFLVFCTFFPVIVLGQNVHLANQDLDALFTSDVTTMSEFRERLNKCVDFKDSLPMDQRVRGLLALFNRSSGAVNAKQGIVKSFVEELLNNSHTIAFNDSEWYAEVICSIKYKGKQNNLQIILKPELLDTNIFRWAICGVSGLREAGILNKTALGYIDPIDNELNFLDMDSRLQKDYKNAFGYKASDAKISQLSIFLFLLQEHQITIEFVDKVKYHFLNVPKYVFIVEFNSTPMNSGWLISDISKLSDQGKKLYENTLFGNY